MIQEIRDKIKALQAKRAELKKKGVASGSIKEVREIAGQIETVDDQLAELEAQLDTALAGQPDAPATVPLEARSAAAPVGHAEILATYGAGQKTNQTINVRSANQMPLELTAELRSKYEERGQALKDGKQVTFDMNEGAELRAVTVGGGTLVVPTHESPTLNPAFNMVSSVIDVVNSIPLVGGEAYKKGFEVSHGEGAETSETGDYNEDEPVFDYVQIGKSKITAYAEMTDESTKLPNVDYQAAVAQSITAAIRKRISRQIIAGSGATNYLTGIFNAPANVMPTASDLLEAEIDETTLERIVLAYGGDEDVEGDAYLFLNKTDLAAFAALRGLDSKRIYQIELNGNTGTISSEGAFKIRYIINSACPALSAVATEDGTYCMAYGKPMAYELPIFSALTVEESRDYKFKSGHVAYRGAVWVGGNVAMYNGFVRVKKDADELLS